MARNSQKIGCYYLPSLNRIICCHHYIEKCYFLGAPSIFIVDAINSNFRQVIVAKKFQKLNPIFIDNKKIDIYDFLIKQELSHSIKSEDLLREICSSEKELLDDAITYEMAKLMEEKKIFGKDRKFNNVDISSLN